MSEIVRLDLEKVKEPIAAQLFLTHYFGPDGSGAWAKLDASTRAEYMAEAGRIITLALRQQAQAPGDGALRELLEAAYQAGQAFGKWHTYNTGPTKVPLQAPPGMEEYIAGVLSSAPPQAEAPAQKAVLDAWKQVRQYIPLNVMKTLWRHATDAMKLLQSDYPVVEQKEAGKP